MLRGSILKNLVSDHTVVGRTPLNFGVYYKNTLVALCHALEDSILASDCSPMVITAFQRGQWYLQEAERYGAIAHRARQIAIMATSEAGFQHHATSQLENVALVDLTPDDPVSQEWHLIILSPSYSAMVLCQELMPEEYGPSGPPEHDLERKFYGFWTFEPTLVEAAAELAIAHIGRYDPSLQSCLAQHLAEIRATSRQFQAEDAVDGMGEAMTRVVNYLQSTQQTLLAQQALNRVEDLDQNLLSNELQAFLRMAQLVDLHDPINPMATGEVASLLEMMGQLLDLPAWRLKRLRLAGLLYRIAPASSPDLSPSPEAPCCPLVSGAQVLRMMPRLRAIATIINHQTEAWDGSGQPAGLMGDQIPLESRMLGLVTTFQQRLAELRSAAPSPGGINTQLGEALALCEREQGQQWDPKLVEILGLMVKGLQQGLSLPSIPTKMSLGAGLLNPDLEEPSEGMNRLAETVSPGL